jgi:hypothetical protein
MMKRLALLFAILLLVCAPGFSTTWFAALPGGITCTTTNTSASIVATESFAAGDVVYFTVVQTPFALATPYYVIATGLSGAHFEVSGSYGGSAITATASGSMTAVGHSMDLIVWKDTQGASCANSGTALTWGSQGNGDTFNSNGCTNLYLTADPGSVSVELTLTNDATNTGGGYDYSTAANATLHTNLAAVSANLLTITGSTGGGTISGNILGGSTTAAYGVYDNAASVTINVIGGITGGSASASYGWFQSSANGNLIVTGNVSLGVSNGLNWGYAGTAIVNGNCVGSDTNTGAGCSDYSTTGGTITVTGSIFNGKKGSGAAANGILFTPAAGNCITYPSSSSGTLQTSCPSSVTANVTQMAPVLTGGLGTTSNVASGVTYGGFGGTASGGASQHNTGFVQ